ncbi:SH3 domain-containing protein [Thermodesulfovibrio sp. 3907-1M]|uniref:SH3 domain-containing protein n=1 Tax=Thermodesulfovibrio autotrophicus TaxID=3118333 RepID=A0AAU8GVN6_9BACT
MKSRIVFNVAALFFLFTTLSWAETITVITKENAIRESPKFFAPVKAYVRYGDILNVIGRQKDWYRVKFKNISGYIHKTAVEKRTVTSYETYTTSTTPSEGEITLAGKGFNPQVERQYRSNHPKMPYDLVDRIEKYSIPEREIISFIKNGGLSEPQ